MFYSPVKPVNIEIREIGTIMPTLFAAYDMDTENGYIHAEHFFNIASSVQRPNIELTPMNGEWYNIYYRQIEKIWESAIPWKKRNN